MEKSDQIISWSSEKLLGLGNVKFYRCSFCKRGFSNAQALGGHMNIHRRDRARLREFSSDQNLLSLDINNSVFPPPSPPPPPPGSLQQEVSLYDEAIICSPSKRLCVTYHEENDHLTSKVNYDHNPLPRPPPPPPPGPANDDLFQREVLSSYDEAIISSPSKRPCFTYEEKDHPTSKVNYDHNPPPPRPPPPANDDLLQREVSSYDETIISSSSKRPCVTYDEENDHLITSKVNNYDHNHEVIIGDLLQLPLFKETSLIKEASTCMDDGQVENKGMQLNHDSELDLELRLGMEPHESSIETNLKFELHKF